MPSPTLTIASNPHEHVVSIHVAGPLVAPDDTALIGDAAHAAPDGFGILINLSAVTRISSLNLAELRRLAGRLAADGHQVAFVCTELMLRAELIVGDLDSVAPVLAADEQAVPLLGYAA
jgi:anti-anti-sigma regulatory factor